MSNRKDDHLQLAMAQRVSTNDFDRVRFVPDILVKTDPDTVDVSVSVFGRRFPNPLYINAMTGGSDKAHTINKRLATLAQACGLPMASGSVSAALKDPSWQASFQVIRQKHPDGFIMANIGLSQTVEGSLQAIELLEADALQVHLNAEQEIVMPEGDRHFSHWPDRLQAIIEQSPVPVIVKGVGFGMSRDTLKRLEALGVQYADVSGKGGTNFITIENARRKEPMRDFDGYGFSTVESLLEGKESQLTLFASGGVRGAFDIVKALALGASMVGLSRFFLNLIENESLEVAIQTTQQLIQDVRNICAILNCSSVDALKQKPLLLDASLQHFLTMRQASKK